jgi:type I restriction-modification system DNA methylase subunit
MYIELVKEFNEIGCHDVLGELYMELGMHNKWHGQFFTPKHIAGLMAKLTEPKKEDVEKRGFIVATDQCCGSGVLLIEFADNCKNIGINFQQDVLFVGQDIDPVVARMCHIQMSILGMPGYVKIGDSLNPKDSDQILFTPFYVLSGFTWRKQKELGTCENEQ